MADEVEDLDRRFSAAGRARSRVRRWLLGWVWFFVLDVLPATKRAIDIAVALAAIGLTAPLWLVLVPWLRARGRVLVRTARVGRYGVPFEQLSLALPETGFGGVLGRIGLAHLPVFVNILKGELSVIGPRAPLAGELDPREWAVRRRMDVRPGLLCLWWIRQRSNIDFDSEIQTDLEYVESRSLTGDLSILLRAIPAALYGSRGRMTEDRIRILGLPIDNVTMNEALDWIDEKVGGASSHHIAFLNAHCANLACGDADYQRVLEQADLVLADGIGLKIGGRILGRAVRQNVNGTDLFPRLCARMAERGGRLYLLGGQPGVPEAVRDWVQRQHPAVAVCGVQHGFFKPEEEDGVLASIQEARTDVLLVALGAPRQDVWIRKNLDRTGAKVAAGVGGLFDFFSGRAPRAPQWMRDMGLEWVRRLLHEPGRMWRRYIVGNTVFLCRVLFERLGLARFPAV